MDTIRDGIDPNGAAARQAVFPALEEPGSLTFQFDDTVYRAVIPLGEAIDSSSTEAVNAHLVPALCDGAALVIGSEPNRIAWTSDPGEKGGSGEPTEWDGVASRFFPVQPGVATTQWKDTRTGAVPHTIMIASGFPDGDIDTGWQIEDAEGYRLDRDGNRILDSGNPATTTAALGSVSDAFPGSPTAHYPACTGAATVAPSPSTSTATAKIAGSSSGIRSSIAAPRSIQTQTG